MLGRSPAAVRWAGHWLYRRVDEGHTPVPWSLQVSGGNRPFLQQILLHRDKRYEQPMRGAERQTG